MRTALGLGIAALGLWTTACSSSAPPPSSSAPPPAVPAVTAAAVGAGVVPLATDPYGAPALVRAIAPLPAPPGASPEAAARHHLRGLAAVYGAPARRVDDAVTLGVIALRGGTNAVLLRQQVDGVPVLGGDVRVLLHADRALSAVAGTLVARPLARAQFMLAPADAVVAATDAAYGVAITASAAAPRGEWIPVAVPASARLTVTEAHVRRVLADDGGALVAAYHVEMFATPAAGDDDALRYVIAADTGRVLERRSLTADETYVYRAWAEATGDRRPFEGPHASALPHPTGIPDGFYPAAVPPNLVAVDSLNALNDPWLPAGATETTGNNAEAYADLNAPDGFNGADLRPTTTSANAFDYTYDLGTAPLANETQGRAAAVALFYTANWLHDWYYDSGFTEVAGNAQASNYGRGGVEGDSMRVEAQDNAIGGSRNNANMSTPSDGLRPRMQVFLWSGENQREIELVGDGTILPSNTASFGPANFDITAEVALVDDGTAPTSNGCEPIVNNVTGRIALIDRGVCTFAVKAQRAQAAGAIGVIIANNAAGVPAPGLGGVDPTITIPVLSTTLEAGNDLKMRLLNGPVSAQMSRVTGMELDGSFDSTVTGHEWGHYFHHRLSDCGTKQCGALSEGWGDFVGLHLALRAGDDPQGTYAVGPHSTYGLAYPNSAYFGIRRYPFSVDQTKNALSFRHIQRGEPLPVGVPIGAGGDNDEVHNAGEVWASMLWEVYVALLEEHGYTEARRRMSDYMVAGLLATPLDSTFTEARDGILTAISTLEPTDLDLAAAAFAVRGNGSCAVAPGPQSVDFLGVVESTTLAGRLAIGGVELLDDGFSCDDDGYLDPGEVGTLRVTVANGGPVALTAIQVVATSADPDLVAVAPGTAASLAPYSSVVISIPVTLEPTAPVDGTFDLMITATATGGCTASLAATLDGRSGVDDTVATSATDDVEAQASLWTAGGTLDDVWARTADAAGGHFLYGRDAGSASDTFLASPAVQVNATAAFTVTLQHAYSFEGDAMTLFDGGMIEVSSDGGMTWVDATTLTTTPIAYTGALTGVSQNPLAGREAFSRSSPGFPARSTLTLDFGTALAGETVQLRFRIGTDAAVGAYGWEIDDLAFAGIDNTPFGTVVDEGPTCQLAPIANAGPDQMVLVAAGVQLDGSASTDPNGETITYAWTQEAGATVTLSDPAAASPTFVAPAGADALTFRLTVSDVFTSTSDTVVVDVLLPPTPDAALPDAAPPVPDAAPPAPDAAPPAPDAAPPAPDAADIDPPDDDGGCGCRTEGQGSAGGMLLLAGVVALGLRRRRRRG